MAKDPFPLDRGWAWAIVAGCFVCVFFMVGTTKSTGMFLNYYEKYFDIPTSLAAMIIGGSAIVYALMAPVCIMVAQKLSIRTIVMLGGIIGCMGIAVSSLLISLEFVMATFSIFFGIANACVYGNVLVILGLYFNKRRSLANGLALSGSAIGQFALPPFIEYLLESFGFSGCLLLVGGVYLHITLAGSLFRPVTYWASHEETARQRKDVVWVDEKAQNNGYLLRSVSNGKIMHCEAVPDSETGVSAAREQSSSVDENITGDMVMSVAENPQAPLISTPKECASVPSHRSVTAGQLAEDEKTDPVNGNISCAVERTVEVDQSSHTDNPESPLVSASTENASAIRKRSHSTDQKTAEDRLSAEDGPSTVPLVSGSVESKVREPGGVLGYRSYMASTGSLNIQPLYGSSLIFEQSEPTRKQSTEEKKDKGLCQNLRDMFDFSVLKSYVAVFILLSSFFGFFGYFNFILFLPATVLSRGIDKYEKAILVSVTGIGDLIGRLTIAAVGDCDCITRYKVQAFGIFAVGLNIGILIWANSYGWMMAHCVLYGYFGGIYVSLSAVVIIDFVGMDHMPRLLAIVLLIQGVGASIGQPLLGGVKDATGSFQSVLAITALCCIVSSLVLLAYPLILKLEYRRPECFRLLPPVPEQSIVV